MTAEAFRGGWFHSGDLGYYDEYGLLHVVDRKKDMIKTGGENVASREVEEVLYRHPGVQEVAVFGIAAPGVGRGRGGGRGDPERRHASTRTKLITHCRAHLAGYKTPKQVFFVDSSAEEPQRQAAQTRPTHPIRVGKTVPLTGRLRAAVTVATVDWRP